MTLTQMVLDFFGPPPSGPKNVSPVPTVSPEEARLAAVAAKGGWQRVVLTRNRRIMASVSRDGRDLRLHRSFATAPDAVLDAVVELFSSRSRARRMKARAVVRAFIAALPAEPVRARSPRPRVALPGDERHLERLQREFDRVNAESFQGSLPRVPLHLSSRMRRRNGHFTSSPVEIVINRRLCTHGVPGEAEHTLRHEMVHLWQHASGRAVDHGADFRAMARRLDVHPRATRPVQWGRARGG